MKVGDLVRIKKPRFIPQHEVSRDKEGYHGIIIDCIEMEDGFYEYEVLFESQEIDWFQDLELEVLSE